MDRLTRQLADVQDRVDELESIRNQLRVIHASYYPNYLLDFRILQISLGAPLGMSGLVGSSPSVLSGHLRVISQFQPMLSSRYSLGNVSPCRIESFLVLIASTPP